VGLERLNEDRIEKAFAYLAESDLELASSVGMVKRTEFLAKVAEALAFKASEGSVEDRKMSARLTPEVKAAWEECFVAETHLAKLRARREREYVIIEVWRTLEASRRRGSP
jgi:hypothetical protein